MVKRKILVVDDSFIMRKLVREIVESDDALEVTDTAENGRVALQKLRQCNPDLILLDLEMPEMSGLQTLRRLGLRSQCKVVVLSSLVEDENAAERLEALRLGAAATIGKPSGALSLDLRQRRGSEIVRTIRAVLGMPVVPDAASAVDVPVAAIPAAPLLSATLAALPVGVVHITRDGVVAHVNPAACTLLRRPVLAPGDRLADMFDEFNEAIGESLWEVIRSGVAIEPEIQDYATPDGSWVPLRIRATAHEGGALLILEDVSRERHLQGLLDRSLSTGIARSLIDADPNGLDAGLRRATILFSDIRGFTNIAETLGAVAVVKFLNQYFSFMADIVRDGGGVIDKFIGDAIMALFGVPQTSGHDPDQAVSTALRMIEAIPLLEEAGGPGSPPIRIGIGLATGDVAAGYLGSPDRMNYTVIGDAVNLASRIESLTKSYGVPLLACGATVAALRIPVAARLLDVVRVKGQDMPTELYALMPIAEEAGSSDFRALYDAAFKLYRAGEWRAAADGFGQALAFDATNAAATMLVARCHHLLAEPPEAAWDGVWTLVEK